MEIKHQALYGGNVEKLKLECRICQSIGHTSEKCLDVEIRMSHKALIDKYLAKNDRKMHHRVNIRSALDIKSGTELKIAI